MHKNVLFRGCTRPAMFMGVPYIPFFIGAGSCMLLALYRDMFYLLLIPPVILQAAGAALANQDANPKSQAALGDVGIFPEQVSAARQNACIQITGTANRHHTHHS